MEQQKTSSLQRTYSVRDYDQTEVNALEVFAGYVAMLFLDAHE